MAMIDQLNQKTRLKGLKGYRSAANPRNTRARAFYPKGLKQAKRAKAPQGISKSRKEVRIFSPFLAPLAEISLLLYSPEPYAALRLERYFSPFSPFSPIPENRGQR